jgi:hypothetical protein
MNTTTDKIEANLNLGMSTAKQQHCLIQPHILPNLLDHSQKKNLGDGYADIAMGALLGTSDPQGKIIEISNSFAISLKVQLVSEESSKDPSYIFDTDYLKKMLKFHRQVNEMENILGVYIS